ncbi:MAG: sialidase family protein [Planctomycetota bacterium]
MLAVLFSSLLLMPPGPSLEESVLVEKGEPAAVRPVGTWTTRDGGLVGRGVGSMLWAKPLLGSGDWTMRATITITDLSKSAASLMIAGSHFGFQGRSGEMFVEGPLFGGETRSLGSPLVHEGHPFQMRVTWHRGELSILIDGEEVFALEREEPIRGDLGLRPHRAQMSVADWSLEGSLEKRPNVEAPPFETDVFVSGTGDYHTFRIPSLLRAPNGDLLAFAEGRRQSRSDTGDIDLVLRRSSDGGRNWSDLQVVWDDAGNTCGNPCPVVDQKTGTIFLLMTWNLGTDHESAIKTAKSEDSRRVFVCQSPDNGRSWSTPREITETTKHPEWRWYATGPGVGIQLERGEHAGRLVIPCDHSSERSDIPGGYGSHIIYSDDHGDSWQMGEPISAGVNECQVIEREDGELLINMRNYVRTRRTRAIATSPDGGETWSKVSYDAALIEPICQASLIRLRWSEDDEAGVLLFSNPASTSGRHQMTVRLSEDQGRTWPIAKTLHEGAAAYSCLVALGRSDIGLLYEKDDYRKITFAAFDEAWLRK